VDHRGGIRAFLPFDRGTSPDTVAECTTPEPVTPMRIWRRGPADEQVVRLDTSRGVHHQIPALVITVAGKIDQFTVDRLRAAVTCNRCGEFDRETSDRERIGTRHPRVS
jgi:hypothetical protein